MLSPLAIIYTSVNKMESLENKVVVITGAGKGIGRCLAIELAQKGAKLALNSRTADHLKETTKLTNLTDDKLFTKAFDISDYDSVKLFAQEVEQYFGHVDIIINNAGVAITGLTFEELEVKDFEWIFSINFMGIVHTTKAFLPILKKQPSNTTIVNISSLFGMIPMVLKTPYASTKYAIRGFTDCLRMELENSNINILGIYPGGIKTGITINALKAEQQPEYTRDFNKLLVMEPTKAAHIIIQGIQRRKKQIIIGKDAKKAIFAYRYFPGLVQKAARKTMERFKR